MDRWTRISPRGKAIRRWFWRCRHDGCVFYALPQGQHERGTALGVGRWALGHVRGKGVGPLDKNNLDDEERWRRESSVAGMKGWWCIYWETDSTIGGGVVKALGVGSRESAGVG